MKDKSIDQFQIAKTIDQMFDKNPNYDEFLFDGQNYEKMQYSLVFNPNSTLISLKTDSEAFVPNNS